MLNVIDNGPRSTAALIRRQPFSQMSLPGKEATIHDVAKLANVSHATVTRALSEWKHPGISVATRERVLAVVKELGYRPSPLAQQLRGRKSRTVCLPATSSRDDSMNPTGAGHVSFGFTDILSGAMSVLQPIGYRIDPFFCTDSKEAEQEMVEMFSAGYFDAAFFPHRVLFGAAERLARKGCIVIGAAEPIEGIPNLIHIPGRSLSWNFMPMIEEVIRQGRTRLGFTFPVPEAALTTLANQLQAGEVRFDYFERGERSLPEYLEVIADGVLSGSLDAVITADEFLGWKIFKLLHQYGIPVPERVTIAGCADVRHIFKPLPILQLYFAEYALYLRTLASKLVEVLSAENPAKFAVPSPLKPYQTRLSVMSPAQFLAAAQTELQRERMEAQVQAEILA